MHYTDVIRRLCCACKQPSQATTAFLRRSLKTWCHTIRTQYAAFASELFESNWSERSCSVQSVNESLHTSRMFRTNTTNSKDLSGKTSRVPASQLSLCSRADVLALKARRAYSTTIFPRHKIEMKKIVYCKQTDETCEMKSASRRSEDVGRRFRVRGLGCLAMF